MKFLINYKIYLFVVSLGSGVWFEGFGRGGRLGIVVEGYVGEGR